MDVVSRGANVHFCFPSQIRSNLHIILRVIPAPGLQTQLPVGNCLPDFMLKPAAQLLGWCRTLVSPVHSQSWALLHLPNASPFLICSSVTFL